MSKTINHSRLKGGVRARRLGINPRRDEEYKSFPGVNSRTMYVVPPSLFTLDAIKIVRSLSIPIQVSPSSAALRNVGNVSRSTGGAR